MEHLLYGLEASKVDRMTFTWLMVTGRLKPLDFDKQIVDNPAQSFKSVLKYMLTVCNNEQEAFFISRRLFDQLNIADDILEDHHSFFLKCLANHKELNR